jgi:hypothetical protein
VSLGGLLAREQRAPDCKAGALRAGPPPWKPDAKPPIVAPSAPDVSIVSAHVPEARPKVRAGRPPVPRIRAGAERATGRPARREAPGDAGISHDGTILVPRFLTEIKRSHGKRGALFFAPAAPSSNRLSRHRCTADSRRAAVRMPTGAGPLNGASLCHTRKTASSTQRNCGDASAAPRARGAARARGAPWCPQRSLRPPDTVFSEPPGGGAALCTGGATWCVRWRTSAAHGGGWRRASLAHRPVRAGL